VIEVAIPSHARAGLCNEATLRLLADRGIPRAQVRVFIDSAEADEYRRTIDPGLVAELVVGGEGLPAQRAAIAAFYPEGTELVQLNDDVWDVRRRVSKAAHEAVVDLAALFARGFALLRRHHAGLWGLYSVLNPFYMRDRVAVGCYFILGDCFGLRNSHAPWTRLQLPVREDYERTLRWWAHYGAVVRLDDVCAVSRIGAPGGLNAPDRPPRQTLADAECHWLAATWPAAVQLGAPDLHLGGHHIRLRPHPAGHRPMRGRYV
jgi:hypothetical protein